jgi:hypothetical protein
MEECLILLELLNKYINQTVVNEGYPVYFIKERIATVRNMRLIIYSNDHNPPHFHVKSNDGSIDAKYSLEDCSLISGVIDSKDNKRIKAYYWIFR